MARRRLALALGATVLLGLVAVLLSRREEALRGPFQSSETTRVAATARAVVVEIPDGASTRVAVVAVPGVGLTGQGTSIPPTPAVESTPLVGEGTPAPDVLAEDTATPAVVSDPRGIAAVRLGEGAPKPVSLGRSSDLAVGDELLLAGGGDPIVVRFAGRASVPLGGSALRQTLLDLELPAGAPAAAGPLLDRQGRLVGVVVPERQAGAPPGHVYAVPIEQAGDLLRRIGAASPVP